MWRFWIESVPVQCPLHVAMDLVEWTLEPSANKWSFGWWQFHPHYNPQSGIATSWKICHFYDECWGTSDGSTVPLQTIPWHSVCGWPDPQHAMWSKKNSIGGDDESDNGNEVKQSDDVDVGLQKKRKVDDWDCQECQQGKFSWTTIVPAGPGSMQGLTTRLAKQTCTASRQLRYALTKSGNDSWNDAWIFFACTEIAIECMF